MMNTEDTRTETDNGTHAAMAVATAAVDCLGLLCLAGWLLAGVADSRLMPAFPYFRQICAFALGAGTVLFPRNLYKAVRAFAQAGNDDGDNEEEGAA